MSTHARTTETEADALTLTNGQHSAALRGREGQHAGSGFESATS
jgi:hypothetical protein